MPIANRQTRKLNRFLLKPQGCRLPRWRMEGEQSARLQQCQAR